MPQTSIETAGAPGQQAIVRYNRIDAYRKTVPSEDYIDARWRRAKRQAIGGNGPVAANDNQDWPLLKALRQDRNEPVLGLPNDIEPYGIARTRCR